MNTISPTTERILSAFCGVVFAIPAVYFGYLTLMLIYTVFADEVVGRFDLNMAWIFVFPLTMTLVPAAISRWYLKKAFLKPLA